MRKTKKVRQKKKQSQKLNRLQQLDEGVKNKGTKRVSQGLKPELTKKPQK